MSTLSLRLPNYLHENLRVVAKQQDVSINQLVTLAVAEKLSYLEAEQYIKSKMAESSREKFEAVLAKVPHAEPDEHDRLNYGLLENQKQPARIVAEKPDVDYEA
jgi:hypothetical protein